MSSRTAAWGQPPVSMAMMREGVRAEWEVRNSASSLREGISWWIVRVVGLDGLKGEGTG